MSEDISHTHCSRCGAEYVNVQHPMKPLGVIVRRLCRCVAEQQLNGSGLSLGPAVQPRRVSQEYVEALEQAGARQSLVDALKR